MIELNEINDENLYSAFGCLWIYCRNYQIESTKIHEMANCLPRPIVANWSASDVHTFSIAFISNLQRYHDMLIE